MRKRFIELRGDFTVGHFVLALAYAELGQRDLAVPAADRAIAPCEIP